MSSEPPTNPLDMPGAIQVVLQRKQGIFPLPFRQLQTENLNFD